MTANILLVIDIFAAIGIIVLVLLQQGKGSDIGAAFGGGGSQSVFGSRGSANFFSRATSLLAIVFFLSSLGLALIYSQAVEESSVTDLLQADNTVEQSVESDVPDVPEDVSGSAFDDVPALPEAEEDIPAVPE